MDYVTGSYGFRKIVWIFLTVKHRIVWIPSGSYGFLQNPFLKIVWICRIVWITAFGSYGLLQKIVWITSQDRMDSARSYGFLLDLTMHTIQKMVLILNNKLAKKPSAAIRSWSSVIEQIIGFATCCSISSQIWTGISIINNILAEMDSKMIDQCGMTLLVMS